MSIQYFKKERGGVNPVGQVRPRIYRDPPKAYFTKKYEPVNVADIMYMYNADNPNGDPTRINENIQMYARGQNPMVEVSYQNAGRASTNTSLGNVQPSNPYKVEVVRPPLMPAETLVPLSAPRIHQNYSIVTNRGIFPQSVAADYDKGKVRLMTTTYNNVAGNVRSQLNYGIQLANERYADKIGKDLNVLLKGAITPSHGYNIDTTRDTSVKYVTETKDLLSIAATTPLSFTDIVVYDPRTNTNIQVEANIKEKNAVAVTAAASAPLEFNTNDGQTIKLKDYEYKVVMAPHGNTQLVITVRQPDVVLDRSSPLYAARATMSLSAVGDSTNRANADKLTLESVLPLISATSSVKLQNYNEAALRTSFDPSKFKLDINLPMASATTHMSGNSLGYNEELARNGKQRDLDKLSNFGSYNGDRSGRPDPTIRGLVY